MHRAQLPTCAPWSLTRRAEKKLEQTSWAPSQWLERLVQGWGRRVSKSRDGLGVQGREPRMRKLRPERGRGLPHPLRGRDKPRPPALWGGGWPPLAICYLPSVQSCDPSPRQLCRLVRELAALTQAQAVCSLHGEAHLPALTPQRGN